METGMAPVGSLLFFLLWRAGWVRRPGRLYLPQDHVLEGGLYGRACVFVISECGRVYV